MRSISPLLALSALSSFALPGCTDDPPTPTELRSTISSDLGNVLRETNASFAGASDGLPGTAATAMVDRVLGTGTALGDGALGQRIRSLTAPLTARTSGALPAAGGDLVDTDAEIAYLNDKLFTDANYLGDGVYQVPASLVCTRTTLDPAGNPVQTIDATCAEQLAKVDLRIRVAREDGALVFAIQVDADHDEPLLFTLTHNSIAITVDLDGAQRAFVALASVFGQDVPNVSLAGRVTGKLEILGTAKARASLTIDRALAIAFARQGADLAGPDAFSLSSAKADVFAITLDGHAQTGSLAVGLGETAVKIPGVAGPAGDQRLELDLPGATANAAFTAGQPLRLTHVGLGNRSTTVSVGGARAVTIDLNAQDGRALDATLSEDAATGKVTLAVSPRLDLQIAVDHGVLGDQPPVYDVTRVLLDGSLVGDDAAHQSAVTGTFSIATSPASYGFTASTGQCVTDSEAIDPATGAAYTRFTVGACL